MVAYGYEALELHAYAHAIFPLLQLLVSLGIYYSTYGVAWHFRHDVSPFHSPTVFVVQDIGCWSPR